MGVEILCFAPKMGTLRAESIFVIWSYYFSYSSGKKMVLSVSRNIEPLYAILSNRGGYLGSSLGAIGR